MIHVECPDCTKSYDVADELAGKVAKCKACGGRIPIAELRAESDTGSTRTAGTSSKSASTANTAKSTSSANDKTQSSKTTPAKPTVKPSAAKSASAKSKLANKQPKPEDFFEDDFEEIEDYDEVKEVEEFEPTRSRRGSSGKRKKKNAGPGFGEFVAGLASSAVSVAAKTPPLVVALVFCFIFGIAGIFKPAIAATAMLACVVIGGLTMAIASLRMVVVTFRISSGWAIFFLFGGLIDIGLAAIGLEVVGALLCFLGFFVSIKLLIENWSEYRGPVHLSIAGFTLIIAGPIATFMGMAGVGHVDQQGGGQLPVANENKVVITKSAASDLGTANPDLPFDVSKIPLPNFEDLRLVKIQGIEAGEAVANPPAGVPNHNAPGMLMRIAYFQPIGQHLPRSLPCVITASAGTNLLSGNSAPSMEYMAEIRPYVDAGFAVIGVSLDGPRGDNKTPDLGFFRACYENFRSAGAGTVNVRNGVEFINQKVPQVDPNRLYIAGHSSAGTLALLAAAHEPRIKGCVAYAPVSNVQLLMKPVLDDSRVARAFPDVANFAKQSSPKTHVAKIKCPVFLFHANDDSNIAVSESIAFAESLKANGTSVEFVRVPTGNHYDSMIQQGIPRAIPWLKQLAGMSDSPAATAPVAAVPPSRPKSAVLKGAELPAFPFGDLQLPPNVARQPSGRVVTFRFQSFSGNGDSTAAARQALRDVPWADLNDLEIDADKSEIRIGQLGGSVDTAAARQSLITAGFQMLPGVSIGNKSSNANPSAPPKNAAAKPSVAKPAATTLEDVPEKSPPASTAASKQKTSAAPPATKPAEAQRAPRAARRVAKFKYERYTGKGSSVNAAREALKRTAWADQEDIELDAKNHEIRIGVTAESPDFEQARKALQNAGFALTPGVTTAITKD